MRIIRLSAVPAVLITLGACAQIGPTTDAERAAGGAVIGAGTAAILDENVVAGAGLGATAGVLADDAGIIR